MRVKDQSSHILGWENESQPAMGETLYGSVSHERVQISTYMYKIFTIRYSPGPHIPQVRVTQ